MTNEETRKQLKEMLEYQIMEKNDREKTSEFIPMAQRQKYMRERAMRNQIESSSMQEGGSNAAMANQKLAPPCKPPLAKPIERYNVVNGY